MKYLKLGFVFILVFYFTSCFEELNFLKQNESDLPNLQTGDSNPLLIAGSANILEILEDMNYKNVLGITENAKPVNDYYKRLPLVGNSIEPDLILVKNLRPDFYLSNLKYKKDLNEKFKNENISIRYFDFSSYENCLNSIIELGKLCNKKNSADQIVQTIETKILELKREIYNKKKPKVLFLLFKEDSIFVGTKNSFVGSLLEVLNVKIIDAYSKTYSEPYIAYDVNLINKYNPDHIVCIKDETLQENIFEEYKQTVEQELESTEAIKNKNYFLLPDNLFVDSGAFKIMHAAEKLKTIIYKD